MVVELLGVIWLIVPFAPVYHPLIVEEVRAAELGIRNQMSLDDDCRGIATNVALAIEIGGEDHLETLQVLEEIVG